MNETVVATEKKKWSKKKKIIVIILCILLFLIVAAICAGLGVLHWYCQVEDYTISQLDETQEATLIAHRGFRGVAPENTLPAFEEAGKAGYIGAECDTYRTKDGVWIITHDINTYRMMDKTANVEKKTYDELMQFTTDNGVNIEQYPDLKICTLEEYLKICVQYNMIAVIELKGKNNTEHYDEIQRLIQQTGANAMFISFHIENLQAIRKLDSSCTVWYLVQEIDDESIQLAKALGGNCGIDFNGNKEENTAQAVQKCIDAGLEVGAWTIDDLETANRLIGMGVTAITTDCITY